MVHTTHDKHSRHFARLIARAGEECADVIASEQKTHA